MTSITFNCLKAALVTFLISQIFMGCGDYLPARPACSYAASSTIKHFFLLCYLHRGHSFFLPFARLWRKTSCKTSTFLIVSETCYYDTFDLLPLLKGPLTAKTTELHYNYQTPQTDLRGKWQLWTQLNIEISISDQKCVLVSAVNTPSQFYYFLNQRFSFLIKGEVSKSDICCPARNSQCQPGVWKLVVLYSRA